MFMIINECLLVCKLQRMFQITDITLESKYERRQRSGVETIKLNYTYNPFFIFWTKVYICDAMLAYGA